MSKVKLPKVPKSKQDLIDIINKEGIEDIVCTTNLQDQYLDFGVMIKTKKGRIFSLDQQMELMPGLGTMEVTDYTSGNGRGADFDFGKGFNETPVWMNPEPKYENLDQKWFTDK